jgi:hypothetical protein
MTQAAVQRPVHPEHICHLWMLSTSWERRNNTNIRHPFLSKRLLQNVTQRACFSWFPVTFPQLLYDWQTDSDSRRTASVIRYVKWWMTKLHKSWEHDRCDQVNIWQVYPSTIPVAARFSAPVHTGLGAHPASLLYNGYRIPFPGEKWSGRGVNHASPSSVEVKERVELYLYSRSGTSWPVLGRTLPKHEHLRNRRLTEGGGGGTIHVVSCIRHSYWYVCQRNQSWEMYVLVV